MDIPNEAEKILYSHKIMPYICHFSTFTANTLLRMHQDRQPSYSPKRKQEFTEESKPRKFKVTNLMS